MQDFLAKKWIPQVPSSTSNEHVSTTIVTCDQANFLFFLAIFFLAGAKKNMTYFFKSANINHKELQYKGPQTNMPKTVEFFRCRVDVLQS